MAFLFKTAIVLAFESGHTIGSIRLLRWSDIDAVQGTIRWRAEHDKMGREHTTPAKPTALAALDSLRTASDTIGEAWIFPSPVDGRLPCSRHLLRDWWERGAKKAGLPKGKRLGWPSFRRQFATELKDSPLRDRCALGGWRDLQTLLQCYQKADSATMRAALAGRRQISPGWE